MAGVPKATQCRFCHKPGELYKGAHPECKNADDAIRHREKKGPPKCYVCRVVVGKGRRYCDKHRDERREQQTNTAKSKSAERMRGYRAAAKIAKPPVVKPPRMCACGCGSELPNGFPGKYVAKHRKPKATPAKRVVFKEADPAKEKPLEGVIITPPDIVVQRVEPVRWMSSLRDLFGVHGKAHTAMD